MIIYDGIIQKGKMHYIIFKNDQNHKVEIPIDRLDASRISLYLNKIVSNDTKILSRGNDEISE